MHFPRMGDVASEASPDFRMLGSIDLEAGRQVAGLGFGGQDEPQVVHATLLPSDWFGG